VTGPAQTGRRLAFLLPDMGGGGAERVALKLMEDFLAAGHRVDLLLLRREGELLPMVPSGVRLIDLAAPRLRQALRPLIRYFREERPDALQASMWPLTVIAIAAHRLARSRARLMVSDHTILSRQYASFGRSVSAALRMTTRLFYPLADACVAVSGEVARDLSALSGVDPARIEVIYNPIAAPPPILPAEREAAEAAWGGADARVLSVGSIKAEKNYPLLIAAFARLLSTRPARLIILGEGPLRPELEGLIAALGLGDRVLMGGFVASPSAYYESADVFTLSSDFEGFGNVLVEAMRAGLAIVSTASGGPDEILADGTYGRLVPAGDEEGFAAALAAALSDRPDPERLRARADALSGSGSARRYLELMLGSGVATGAR
jgi:glycosyltransferase involved in cell wall biosynthesis